MSGQTDVNALADEIDTAFNAYLEKRGGVGRKEVEQILWDNKALIVAALRRPATTPDIQKVLDEVRTEIGAGYGWGAWTREEYDMAERVFATVNAKLSTPSAPDQRPATTEPVRAALERSIIAIDDWLNVYASDMCDPERVQEAQKRIGEYGTLSYIADVQEQNRAALAPAGREAVPVAWWAFCQKTGGEMVQTSGLKDMLIEQADSLYAEHGYELHPLYASPQPDARIGRKEAISLANDAIAEVCTFRDDLGHTHFKELAKAVRAAITAGKD